MKHVPAPDASREAQSDSTAWEPHDSALKQGPLHISSTDTAPRCLLGFGSRLDSFLLEEDTGIDNQRPTLPAFSLQDDFWCSFMGENDANTLTPDLDPFSGFDIPFWFDEEQHWDFMQ